MKLDEYIARVHAVLTETPEHPVYIYGAGKYAGALCSLLQGKSIRVDGFLVTDIDSNFSELMGLPVLSINAVDDFSALILIGFLQRGEIMIQDALKSKGFQNVLELPEGIKPEDSWTELRYKSPILEVTPKIGCSVNCRYCPQSLLTKKYFAQSANRKKLLSLEEYKILLDKTPENLIVDWSGFVEPFLNPEAIDMMEYTEKAGHKQALFTTLQGLTQADFERMLRIPFAEVVLHTADQNGYANIPVTEEYLNRIDVLLTAKKPDGSPFITSANCQFTPSRKVEEHTAGKLKIYCEMQDRAGNLDDPDDLLAGKKSEGEICCARTPILNHNVLLPDGTVVLCCNDFGLENVLGNLFAQSYEDLMHSETMREVKRKMHIETESELLCRQCMYAEECRK